jgi:hypothetical protein
MSATRLFEADGFSILSDREEYYVSDGASVLHLQGARLQGDAFLDRSFFSKPLPLQRNFWSFGLLKLLRRLGFYSLHAAGLVAPKGWGILISGPPGRGKSTLAVGLVRKGWGYLSDDAVLLCMKGDTISTLALRQHFYIDAAAASRYEDLLIDDQISDSNGRQKRRLGLEQKYPRQKTRDAIPRVLVFPKIIKQDQSALVDLDHVIALKYLLAASGPQLFDRRSMTRHIEVLRTLLDQTAVYQFRAGRDVFHDPEVLVHCLKDANTGVE